MSNRLRKNIIVALALMLTLSGCGKPVAQSSTPQSSSQVQSSQSSQEPAAPQEEPLKEFSFATSVHYADQDFAKLYAEKFKEDTGITMNLINIPNDQWEDKINAMLVSGDLPDIFRGNGKINQYAKQEYIIPIDDFIAANPEIKALTLESPEVYDSFVLRGETYALTLSHSQNMTMWVRADLLAEENMAMPTNMDELMKMFLMLKTKSPDIVLTTGNSLQAYETISSAFGTRITIFEKDGKFIDPVTTPEYKEFLDYMRTLYAEGILDKEFAGQGYGQQRTKVYTGVASAIVMWDNTGFEQELAKNNVDGQMLPIPPFKTEKGAFGQSFYPPNDNAYMITSACKQPQQVFDAFFNWNLLTENGIVYGSIGAEGHNYNIVDGEIIPTDKGIGFHGQHVPSHLSSFEYPFKFNEATERRYGLQNEIRENYKAFATEFNTVRPPLDCTDFWDNQSAISGSSGKIAELSYSYWIGDIDYDTLIKNYNAFADEIGIPNILAQLNG